MDLLKLKHENEKLRELLKDEKIFEKKLIVEKQDGNRSHTMISNKSKWKQQRIAREKNEISTFLPQNGFSMKHEVKLLLFLAKMSFGIITQSVEN